MYVRLLKSPCAFTLLLSFIHFSIHVASAQARQAELTGEVRDQSGALIPDAKITTTGVQSNQSYITTTGSGGVYTFTGLKPGIYTVAVEATGFKRYVREGVQLTTGEKVRLDIPLEVGAVGETISIKADAPLLRNETGSLGQVISNRKTVDLPLNGRTFVPLVALAPGVALPPASFFLRINGGRPRTNEYLFDGISVLQPEPGQGVFSVDRSLGSGYAQQWNLAIQQEITNNLYFEVAYAGSKITHVGIPDTNINQLTVEQLKMGPALLQRVPNPFFGQIPPSSSLGDPTIPLAQLLKPFPRFTTVSLFRNNVGNTNYNALQVKVEKRLSQGYSFLVCYTRSKLISVPTSASK